MNNIPDFKLLWKQYKPVVFGLLLVSGLYFLLRLPNLLSLPIFADEAIYIRWAQIMRSVPTLRFVSMQDGKQPLFMWLMIPLLKLISDPLLAGRLLSVLSGWGTMMGIFFLSLQFFKSQKVALTSSLLYALVPYGLFFDRMALVDSMLTMWSVWAMVFVIKLAKKPTLDFGMLSGVFLGFAWLTKSTAMFFVAMTPFSGLLMELPKKPGPRSSLNKVWLTPRRWKVLKWLFFLGMSLFIAVAIYNILRLGPEFQQIALRNKDYVYPLKEVLDHPFFEFSYKLKTLVGFYWKLLTPLLFLLAWQGWLMDVRKNWKRAGFLSVWIFMPVFYQFWFARSLTARYYLYTIPPMLMLTALAWQWWLAKSKSMIWKIIVASLVLVPCLWLDFRLLINPYKADLPRVERSGYLEEWTAGQGLREVANYIKNEAQVNSIVVGTEGFFGTMPDGLQIYFDKSPNVTVIGLDPDVRSVSDQLYNSLAENKVYLLVNSTRLSIEDPEAVGLHLIRSFPKGQRPDGTQESLLFFELIGDFR